MTPELLSFFTGLVLGAAIAGLGFGFSYAGFVLRAGSRREWR